MIGQNVLIVPQKDNVLGSPVTINQLQNTISTKSAASSDITINMGWKLHGALKEELSIDEALTEIGLKRRMISPAAVGTAASSGRVRLGAGARFDGYDLVDENSFNLFSERLKKLGIDVDIFDAPNSINREKATQFFGAFFSQRSKPKVASILDQVSLFETLHDNGIEFKYSREVYGEGKALTTYAGSLEERDRVIAVLEDAMGDKFQDARRALGTLSDKHREVNSAVSDKFYGRFTTEYASINPDGSLNLAKDDVSLSDSGDTAGRGRVTGAINDDEVRRLGELVDDNPSIGELLHGKPGYDSPYSTIEDIIQERQKVTPAQAAAASSVPPATGSAANNMPPTPTTGAPTPVAQAAAASSVPPATGSAANASASASSAATIGTPATKISTSTAQAQAQAQASSNAQATSSTQRQTTQARVSSTPAASAVTAPSAGSTGAPVRGTQSLLKAGRGLSASVASGTKGYGNLKVLGAGLLVGIGAQKIASNQRENSRQKIDY